MTNSKFSFLAYYLLSQSVEKSPLLLPEMPGGGSSISQTNTATSSSSSYPSDYDFGVTSSSSVGGASGPEGTFDCGQLPADISDLDSGWGSASGAGVAAMQASI